MIYKDPVDNQDGSWKIRRCVFFCPAHVFRPQQGLLNFQVFNVYIYINIFYTYIYIHMLDYVYICTLFEPCVHIYDSMT